METLRTLTGFLFLLSLIATSSTNPLPKPIAFRFPGQINVDEANTEENKNDDSTDVTITRISFGVVSQESESSKEEEKDDQEDIIQILSDELLSQIIDPDNETGSPDYLSEFDKTEIIQNKNGVLFPGGTPVIEEEIVTEVANILCDEDEEAIKNSDVYNEAVEECLAEDQMPFWNTTANEYQCFDLLEQGPCNDTEWLIIDESNDDLKAICAERPCGGDPRYIPFSNSDECVALKSGHLCHKNFQVLATPTGQGECSCREGFLTHPDSRGFDQCYQEFLQGPCGEGQQLIQPPVLEDGSQPLPTCVPTDCPANQVKFGDNVCVTITACSDDKVIKFDIEAHTANCADQLSLRQLASVPTKCDSGEVLDHENNCSKVRQRGNNIKRRFSYGGQRNLRNFLRNRRRHRARFS